MSYIVQDMEESVDGLAAVDVKCEDSMNIMHLNMLQETTQDIENQVCI